MQTLKSWEEFNLFARSFLEISDEWEKCSVRRLMGALKSVVCFMSDHRGPGRAGDARFIVMSV